MDEGMEAGQKSEGKAARDMNILGTKAHSFEAKRTEKDAWPCTGIFDF